MYINEIVISNTKIKERMCINIDIIKTIKVKWLRWYRHIKRMTDRHLVKAVWEGAPVNNS